MDEEDVSFEHMANALGPVVSQAVEEHLAKNNGGLLLRFNFVADIVHPDGSHGWITAHADRQTVQDTYAMALWGLKEIEANVECIMRHDHG